jgi:hypothetical protein
MKDSNMPYNMYVPLNGWINRTIIDLQQAVTNGISAEDYRKNLESENEMEVFDNLVEICEELIRAYAALNN